MNWYLKALKQYADFKGRARRKEYWMFTLINFLIYIAVIIINTSLALTFGGPNMFSMVTPVLFLIYILAVCVPSLAVTARRLHDIGKSGTWFFIGFIPLVGPIWLLVLMCIDGDNEENQYGPNPKKEEVFSEEALDSHLTN